MSEPELEYDEDENGSRRRAIWGMSVLVMLAVIVVTLVVLFTGTHKGGPDDETGIDDSTLSGAVPTTSATSTSSSTPTSSSTHPVPTSSSRSRSTSPSSSSSEPGGDPSVAALADGINQLRGTQHLPSVPAMRSAAADACAASRGGGPTCVPHYMYAQVASQDGKVALTALEGVNKSWLLDAGTTRIEIGWSKLPNGRFNCALLKFP